MKNYKTNVKNYVRNTYPTLFCSLKEIKNTSICKQDYISVIKKRYERTNPTPKQLNQFEQLSYKNCLVTFGQNNAYAIKKLLKKIDFNNSEFSTDDSFFCEIDVFKTWHIDGRLMVNSTLDYDKILNGSLNDLYIEGDSEFATQSNIIVDALKSYLQQCISFVKINQYKNGDNIVKWLSNIEKTKAFGFEESLQRILFVNMVLWQTSHRLVGLGRLDLLLNDFYNHDISCGVLNKDKTLVIIKEFLKSLHKYYWFKSDALLGDTGQIIILGGNTLDGGYFCNDLTHLFIQAIKEVALPDPKVLLRTGNNMPKDLLMEAVQCIATGIGCPLLSNDEEIVSSMIEFGYDKTDAFNYVTSACWEPLVPAISHEQNNISLYNFLLPIQLILEKEQLTGINSFDVFLKKYFLHLEGHISYMNNMLDEISWERDPLISVFTESCRESQTDISNGGGKYNNYGILTVAMSNAVNSLLIIKKYVFDQKKFDLFDLRYIICNNFKSHDDIRNFLQKQKYYGTDNEEAIELANKILKFTSSAISKYRNCFGGKIKFGLSSPGYIEAAQHFPASFDGRKYGTPFAVHISGDDNASFTELMNFASRLDYAESRFNGNVVDFFVSPLLIQNNLEKFVGFLYTSLQMGVAQMQINVIDSETLIKAKNNPLEYTNLIVRVWGFSAYFIDLPEEYKNYLIERAKKSEGKV